MKRFALALCGLALVTSGCDSAGIEDSILEDLTDLVGCSVDGVSPDGSADGDLDDDCTSSDIDLDAIDPVEDYNFDFYAFDLEERSAMDINLESEDFDTVLGLFDEDGELIVVDDDGGDELNSRIQQTLSAGVYLLAVTTYDEAATGGYNLSLDASADSEDGTAAPPARGLPLRLERAAK